MADAIISAGYYNFGELAGTSTAERAQLREILAGGRAGWARLLRKMIDAKTPPTEVAAKKSPPFKEVDIFAAVRANPSLSGIGELLRPRQQAAN